jgi:hypothetical protein
MLGAMGGHGLVSPDGLLARMERSVIRDRPTPDYAALHSGYDMAPLAVFMLLSKKA